MPVAIDEIGANRTDAWLAGEVLATRNVQGSALTHIHTRIHTHIYTRILTRIHTRTYTHTMPNSVCNFSFVFARYGCRSRSEACRHYPCLLVCFCRVQGLHKRFFTLKGSTLKYYKDPTCKNLRTKIELHAGTLVHRLSKTMFTIKSGDQNLSLVAEDECTCDSWVDALKVRVEAASGSKKNELEQS